MEKSFDKIADDRSIEKTAAALRSNGIHVIVVENGEEAKAKVLEIIPEGSEIMNMTSMTLENTGLTKELLQSENYDNVRNKLTTMDKETHGLEMRKMGAAPQWAIGSVNAVAETGSVLVASATGSQLPAYSYGSAKVLWVVGAQKIVQDVNEGIKRIYEYTLPLENERAMKAYGMGSGVNKLLIINKEVEQNRITMILIKENIGF